MADINMQMRHHNGTSWDNLYPKTKAGVTVLDDGRTVQTAVTANTTSLSNKVDKVTGKSLTTNDFTTVLKTKLDGLKDHTTEINTLTSGKADKNTTFTKTEVTTSLGLKADKATTYSKTEVDTLVSSVQSGGIPVTAQEPSDASVWFQIL